MATVVIRNVEAETHARLKAQAAEHGRSMEEEARVLLRRGVEGAPLPAPGGLVAAIRALFEPLGGFEMPEIVRDPPRDPPDFTGIDWHDGE